MSWFMDRELNLGIITEELSKTPGSPRCEGGSVALGESRERIAYMLEMPTREVQGGRGSTGASCVEWNILELELKGWVGTSVMDDYKGCWNLCEEGVDY